MRAALLGLALLAGPAAAQQVLYEPPPPPGAAQVRFVNAAAAPVTLRPSFGAAVTLGTAPAERIGRYTVVPAVAGKSFTLSIGAQQLPLTLPPNSQVTVVLVPDAAGLRAQAITDEVEFNQTRARLRFYNATPDCAGASLAVQPAGTRVFGEVAPGEARMRAVNPVTAEVQAGCATGQAPVVPLRNLEVGAGYSIWLMAPGGALTAFITADGNKPYAP
jgi:hypothetical protein